MNDKPATATGYPAQSLELVRSTCLYVATVLGDFRDDTVVVGGLVPSLLIPPHQLPESEQPHVGTMDLDIGLAVAVLDQERYRALASRLRLAGFEQDVNERGNRTNQRWRISEPGNPTTTVDFLIPPVAPDDAGGRLRHLEPDLAATITPGLHLAFEDRELVSLAGHTVRGETARREVWVCGPGAFIVLKALAFSQRGEGKDAYDLYYVVRNYGTGVADVVRRLEPLVDDPDTRRAMDSLVRNFVGVDALGPQRVARFLTGGPDPIIQADVAGFVENLVRRCEPGSG